MTRYGIHRSAFYCSVLFGHTTRRPRGAIVPQCQGHPAPGRVAKRCSQGCAACGSRDLLIWRPAPLVRCRRMRRDSPTPGMRRVLGREGDPLEACARVVGVHRGGLLRRVQEHPGAHLPRVVSNSDSLDGPSSAVVVRSSRKSGGPARTLSSVDMAGVQRIPLGCPLVPSVSGGGRQPSTGMPHWRLSAPRWRRRKQSVDR